MKKLTIIILVTFFLATNNNFKVIRADSSIPLLFNDITNHWAEVSIIEAVKKGFVEGYPDGTFKPDVKVTRAEFIKLTIASLRLPVSSEPMTNWYDPYVIVAKDAGIYTENDFTTGNMNTPMTRFEMSRAAVRATGQMNDDPDKWMYLATKAGLIQGMDKTGLLGEDQSTTRAQSITVIERILTIKGGGTLPADKHAVNRAEVLWHHTNIFSVMPEIFDVVNFGKNVIDKWDKNKMFVEPKNGLYKATLDSLIAIDLGDKDDPNWNLVPANLKWYDYPNNWDVRKYTDAYLILPVSHVDFNKDQKIYSYGTLAFEFYGSYPPDNSSSFPNGTLLSAHVLTLDGTKLYGGIIVPKDTKSLYTEIGIRIRAIAMAPHDLDAKKLLVVKR
ncbi:MAG: S-layer homology domain-containing protein [Paenibacillaceae bacterium]